MTHILLLILTLIPVPQPDSQATPPVTLDDAAEFCTDHGGTWNQYGPPDNTWFQCDDGKPDPFDDVDASDSRPDWCDGGMTDEMADADYDSQEFEDYCGHPPAE